MSYSKVQYSLIIGQLVNVWTTHTSNGDRGMFPCSAAPIFVKIFPEKDKSCHLRIVDDFQSTPLCRVPPRNYESGLMSLNGFVHGGAEVKNARILVMVKSISARKKGDDVPGVFQAHN